MGNQVTQEEIRLDEGREGTSPTKTGVATFSELSANTASPKDGRGRLANKVDSSGTQEERREEVANWRSKATVAPT